MSPWSPSVRGREVLTATAAAGLVVGVTVATPEHAGPVLAALVLGVLALVAALGDPVLAVLLAVVASFLRYAVRVPGLPVEPYVLALAVAAVAVAAAVSRGRLPAVPCGPVEIAMLAYLGWNLVSWVLPHDLPASGGAGWIARYLISGTVFPFALWVLGRTAFGTERAVHRLLGTVLVLGGVSALSGLAQFHGPSVLVWPRFLLTDPGWPDRAVGLVRQPVVNGLLLVLAVPLGLMWARRADLPRWVRWAAAAVAAGSVYGIYLTHTRVVWLAFVAVLVAGAVLGGRALRRDLLTLLGVLAVAAVANLATLRGSDRAAGGVGSTNEIMDRLNIIATGLWAVAERPSAGWGIGRFAAVNTVHHRQWAPWTDWDRGFGLVAHENEIGVATELGLVGLALWFVVLGLVARAVWTAVRTRPGVPTIVAALALLTYLIVGTTVDLRFLEFGNGLVFLLAGAAVATPVPRPDAAGARSDAVRAG